MHPALAPTIERAAYLGGCDDVSATVGAELLGIAPTGTMPHALILGIGDTVEATLAFDRVDDPAVPFLAHDRLARPLPAPQSIRQPVLQQLQALRLWGLRADGPRCLPWAGWQPGCRAR